MSSEPAPVASAEGGGEGTAPSVIWKARVGSPFREHMLKYVSTPAPDMRKMMLTARETWGVFSGFLIIPVGEGGL